MKYSKTLASAGLFHLALGLPRPQMTYEDNKGDVGGIDAPIPTYTGAPVGDLRGSTNLQGGIASRPPVDGGDSAIVEDPQLVGGQEADAKLGLYLDFNSAEYPNGPQPIRGGEGQTDPGPRTYEYEKLNPDTYAPPSTDKGTVPQAMWPLGLSHNLFGSGEESGWARQQNQAVLPVATQMAGVDMRLAPNAYRELHWHTSGEWALVLKGSVRVAALDSDGATFVDDVTAGDVWFFPQGVPHSLQALHEGAEFLLIFDSGTFSETDTFLATEMLMRTPVSVWAKDLQTDVSSFDDIPDAEKYIFNGTPAPANISEQNITSSAGALWGPSGYTYHWSQQEFHNTTGGSVKILDPATFPVAEMFSAALVVLEPGAMREVHWHTESDEWSYFLQGSARITIYAAPASSQTFDFTAGDVGYIQKSAGHYIENTGTEDVIFLEVLQAKKFSDISAAQWLALTPRQIIKDTLNLSDAVLDAIPKEKTLIKPGNPNMTAIAGGGQNY
ncbi:Bicupin, oxalate decarboxylase/oxidase [Daldinia vernicosa]|uniref:Bicupin, oxalate decarboxylase/oxidase n=1 Tax=Daldinia vernicosa TaxID=114800 RepID=UPI002008A881|nr:Bicupin, oxalate decarboxylase/oxidase [Daldinia vernicosa]KAI0846753.1 Bicupin, oxalate decarboxylase/oxidase [Daldinia vernicosa]